MLSLLIRLFIKNKDDVTNAKVRENYGILCGAYGIFLNILLFIGKYIAGMLSASIAMMADAFNNLSDACSSLVSVIGIKLANQKPDPEHPFGHGRLEYISGLIVSGIIIIMGYELVKDSFGKIITPSELTFSWVSIIILAGAILVKFYMAMYSHNIGKKIDSSVISAVAVDSLSDTVATSVVLVSTLVSHFAGIRIDGWCGLLVGGLIVFAGFKAAKETMDPLLGQPPEADFVNQIEEIVMKQEHIIGIHDLIVHDYGPGRVMISLHAEVPCDKDVRILHDEIDLTEMELHEKLGCHAVIHMDPVETTNPEVNRLKDMVKEELEKYDSKMKFHDFRVVMGNTHTNLIFDVVTSFENKKSDEQIAAEIYECINAVDEKYRAVVNVDRDYVSKE